MLRAALQRAELLQLRLREHDRFYTTTTQNLNYNIMETEWIFDERVLYICAALYIAIIAAIIWVIRRHMELDKVTEMFSRCSCEEPEPTEDGAYCMSCGKMIII